MPLPRFSFERRDPWRANGRALEKLRSHSEQRVGPRAELARTEAESPEESFCAWRNKLSAFLSSQRRARSASPIGRSLKEGCAEAKRRRRREARHPSSARR